MLTQHQTGDMPLLMPVHGWVRGKGKCPYCKGSYNHENGFRCCHTVPERFFVYLPSKYSKTNKAEYFYSTLDGDPLDSITMAHKLASALEVESENSPGNRIDVTRFSHQQIKPLLMENISQSWLKSKSDLSPSHQHNCRFNVEHYFLRYTEFKKIDVRRIDSFTIERFKQWLDKQSNKEKLSISSKASIVNMLMNMISYAAMGYNFKVPAIVKIKLPKKSKKILTTAQQNLIIQNINYEHDIKIFYFLFGTGVRDGEACALRWPNILWDKGMANICENFSRGVHRPITKGLRPRKIGLDLKYPLTKMLREMYENTIDRKGFVFKPVKAKHYTPQNLNSIYYKARKEITDITLREATRSSFIVWHLEKYNDIRYTQKHVGHTDIATTQIYLDEYNEEKRYLELVKNEQL